jgi:PIN domain nuclease of toxin-antitoxin system
VAGGAAMILLDTCALLWLANGSDDLSPTTQELLRANAGSLFVSAFSAWEIALKHRRGRLELPLDTPAEWFAAVLEQHGLREIPVDSRIAAGAVSLPPLHTDPADRILVATAQTQGLTLLTPDALIRQYPELKTAW